MGLLIVQPDAISDMKKFSQLNKEYKDLEKVVKKYDEYSRVLQGIKGSKEILEQEKDQLRMLTMQALGCVGLGARKALPALINIAMDKNETVPMRCQAIGAITSIGRDMPEAIAALNRLVADPDEQIRSAAALAVEK